MLSHYLDAGNADPALPLTDQGKPLGFAKPNCCRLTRLLDFAGSMDDARAFFDALPPAWQRVIRAPGLLRELPATQSADRSSPREGSYCAAGKPLPRCIPKHDGGRRNATTAASLYQGAGLQTRSGGNVGF